MATGSKPRECGFDLAPMCSPGVTCPRLSRACPRLGQAAAASVPRSAAVLGGPVGRRPRAADQESGGAQGAMLLSWSSRSPWVVAAPAERVWNLLAHPEQMTALSPEVERVDWTDATVPKPGAMFGGHNRVGPVRWSTANIVEAVEPSWVFSWRTVEQERVREPLDLPYRASVRRLRSHRAV